MSDVSDMSIVLKDVGDAVSSIRTQQAVRGANDEVQRIRDSDQKEAQKMAAMKQVGTNLAMQMASYGASPEDAQKYANVINPKPTMYQNSFEAYASGDPQRKKDATEFEKMRTENAMELARAKNSSKPNNMAPKTILAQKKEFQALVKPFRESASAAESIFDMADKGESVAAMAMIKRGLIKASGDNKISDADLKAMNLVGSSANQTKELISNIVTGKTTKVGRDEAKLLAGLLKQSMERRQSELAQGFSKSRSKQIGVDEGEFLSELLMENNLSPSDETSAPRSASAPGATPTAPAANGPSYLKFNR